MDPSEPYKPGGPDGTLNSSESSGTYKRGSFRGKVISTSHRMTHPHFNRPGQEHSDISPRNVDTASPSLQSPRPLMVPQPQQQETNSLQQPTDSPTPRDSDRHTSTCRLWARDQCTNPETCLYAHYFFPIVVNRAFCGPEKQKRCEPHQSHRGCTWSEDVCGMSHEEIDPVKQKVVHEQVKKQKWETEVWLKCKLCSCYSRNVEDMVRHTHYCRGNGQGSPDGLQPFQNRELDKGNWRCGGGTGLLGSSVDGSKI